MKVEELISILENHKGKEIEAVISFQEYAGAKIKHEAYEVRNVIENQKKIALDLEYIGEQ